MIISLFLSFVFKRMQLLFWTKIIPPPLRIMQQPDSVTNNFCMEFNLSSLKLEISFCFSTPPILSVSQLFQTSHFPNLCSCISLLVPPPQCGKPIDKIRILCLFWFEQKQVAPISYLCVCVCVYIYIYGRVMNWRCNYLFILFFIYIS